MRDIDEIDREIKTLTEEINKATTSPFWDYLRGKLFSLYWSKGMKKTEITHLLNETIGEI